MLKRLLPLVCLFALVLSIPVFAQEGSKAEESKESPKKEMAEHGKQGRAEGFIARTSPDKHMFTVRQNGTSNEKTVMYDDSTKFTSQEHGSKTANKISADDIKDNDRVIAIGTYDKEGVLHASMVSKRLTKH